jgi:hypothetical protein
MLKIYSVLRDVFLFPLLLSISAVATFIILMTLFP